MLIVDYSEIQNMNKIITYAIICMALIILTPIAYATEFGSAYSDDTRQPYGPTNNGNLLNQWSNKQTLSGWWDANTQGILGQAIGGQQDLGETIIVNVKNYEPNIVGQSILEQNDVPVFVTLIGTTTGTILSPFTKDITQEDILTGIKTPSIKRIDIQKVGSNNFVSDVRFYTPRGNAFSLNNLGYVRVNLKKLQNESALPEDGVVTINMTAKIYFDLLDRGLFNIGPQTLTLRAEPDEKAWLNKINKQENRFDAGKGYLRATSVDRDAASFIIYDNSERLLASLTPANYARPYNPIRSFTLKEGKTQSYRIGYTGNPFEDFVSITLDSVVGINDRATFEFDVNGAKERRVIMKGKALYPGSNWMLTGISKSLGTPKTKEDLFAFGISPSAIENLASSAGVFQVIQHRAEITNYNTGQSKTIVRYIIDNQEVKIQINDITPEVASLLENKYCDKNKFDDPAITNQTLSNYGCQAMLRLKTFLQSATDQKEAGAAYKTLAEIYANYLIDYTSCDITNSPITSTGVQVRDLQQCNIYKRDMELLAYHYYKKLESTYPQLLMDYNERLQGSDGADYLDDENIGIALRYVEPLTEVDKGSFKYRINNGNELQANVGSFLVDNNGLITGTVGNKQFKWKVTEIYPRYIKIRQTFDNTGKESYGQEKSFYLNKLDSVPVTIKSGFISNTEQSTTSMEVLSIDTKTQAVVTITPGNGEAFSSSNFTIHIPIEKRPWKFTPEQIKAQIDAVNQVVEKLDNIIDKLDSIVRTWKKVCLLTFTALTVKNSLFAGGARVMARRTVAEFYKQECAKDDKRNIDDCLYDKSSEITAMTSIEEDAIKKADDAVAGKTRESLMKDPGDASIAMKMESTLEEYRDNVRLTALKGSVKDKEYLDYVKSRSNDLGYQKKIDAYKNAEGYFSTLERDNPTVAKELVNGTSTQKGFGTREDAIAAIAQASVASIDLRLPDKVKVLPVIRESVDGLSATGTVAEIKAGARGNILTGLEGVKLTRLTQLEYDVINAGGIDKFKKGIGDTVDDLKKQTSSITPQLYLASKPEYSTKAPATESGRPIYINEKDSKSPQDLFGSSIRFSSTDNIQLYTSPYTGAVQNLKTVSAYSQAYKTRGALDAEYDNQGYVYCVPSGQGEYIYVYSRYNTGEPSRFEVRNVGENGLMDCNGAGDDPIVHTSGELEANQLLQNKYKGILAKFNRCTKEGQVIDSRLIPGLPIKCSSKGKTVAADILSPKCIDTMDPADCRLLFNACDPVMCPTSRCNLGGTYKVDNVVQTGIIGSVVLCAPNIKQGIAVPVCLTGILAGLKNLRSFIKGYADCLDISLKKGQNVGLCSYIRSVGICELLWREVVSIVQMRGGLIDLFTRKLSSQSSGGGEYLKFKESLDNIGDSFNYFTTDYQNSFLAYYKGKSTEEIGSQICRLQVAGKLPSFGEILDKLSEPENPPQFTAFFDTAPWMETIGETPGVPLTQYNTKELSKYRVFYHIYAGDGYANQQNVLGNLGNGIGSFDPDKVTYMVYLRGPGLPPLYVTGPENYGVSRRTLERGGTAIETIEKVGPKGYDQLCIVINQNQEQCGFGKVSSDYAINWLNDKLVSSDAATNITSAEQCSPEYPRTAASAGSIPTPEQYGILSSGIIRKCSQVPPTSDYNRWQKVGTCGYTDKGIYLGDCWIDVNSISIKHSNIKAETYSELKAMIKGSSVGDLIDEAKSSKVIGNLNLERDRIITQIADRVEQEKQSNAARIALIQKIWEQYEKDLEEAKRAAEKSKTQPVQPQTYTYKTCKGMSVEKDSQYDDSFKLASTKAQAIFGFSVDWSLLKAMACYESGLNPTVNNKGIMQITAGPKGGWAEAARWTTGDKKEQFNACANDPTYKDCQDETVNSFAGAIVLSSSIKQVNADKRFEKFNKVDRMKFAMAGYILGVSTVGNVIQNNVDKNTFNDLIEYLNVVDSKNPNAGSFVNDEYEQYLSYKAGAMNGVTVTGDLIWPLPDVPQKIWTVSNDPGNKWFGAPRECTAAEKYRVHVGIDLLNRDSTKVIGTRVVAMEDGIVVSKGYVSFTDSKEGKTCALFVYNEPDDRTINYGEVDCAGVNGIGYDTKITKGMQIGVVGATGMLHLEVYSGKVSSNIQWYVDDAEQCNSKDVAVKSNRDQRIQDPYNLLSQVGSTGVASVSTGIAQVTKTNTQTAMALGQSVPYGAEVSIQTASKIIQGDKKPTASTVANWEDAAKGNVILGSAWIGKLDSNGANDKYEREDNGRDTIIFVPYTTNFLKPIEIAYFFHGDHGFCGPKSPGHCGEADMRYRVLEQAKIMSDQKRNFVIVFPEMPWSAGLGNYNPDKKDYIKDRAYVTPINGNSPRKAMIWETTDSNLYALYQDVLNILHTKFSDKFTVGYISLTGHSAGGAALSYAARKPNAQDNYLKQIQASKIVFSDSDYYWGGSSGAVSVYENYVKDANAQIYLIVQDPSRSTAHAPTKAAIDFTNKYAKLNWQKKAGGTPGAVSNKPFTIPNTNNKVIYLPLTQSHILIGRMSMAWLPAEAIPQVASVDIGNEDSLNNELDNQGIMIA